MKKSKKHPRKQLEKFSNIFMQLGLVLVLFVVFVTLEHQTEKKAQTITDVFLEKDNTTYTMSVFTKIPKIVKVQQTQPRVIPRVTPLIDFKPVKETPTTQVDEPNIVVPDNTPVVVTNLPLTPKKEEPKPTGPVSINNVQKAPVFKGCEGLSEVENRKCFEQKMKELVLRNFNTDLANELGLRSGKKKIITQFVIDQNGLVIDVQIRAPHPTLKKEANRIIGKIPKLTPGIQNDKAVNVRYTLPISFMVE